MDCHLLVRFRRAVGWLGLAFVCWAADAERNSVDAAAPVLQAITPCGAQRGTEVDVVLAGARLSDAQHVFFYEPGMAATKVEAVPNNPNAAKMHLAIAPDCRLGPHPLRVRTASGVSNLMTFSVGPLPETAETEPNNDFNQPQKINLDATVNGVVENEDVDYYLVEAKKGERLTAEIEGFRLGITLFDPALAILDKNRFVLDGADDTPLLWQDAVCSIIAPEDGAYIIQVRESAFGGSPQCLYRLHVGRFPRPRAVYAAGGKTGQTLDVRWLADAAGERAEKLSLPGALAVDFGLLVKDDRGTAPWPQPFRLSSVDNVMETEPNNDAGHATAATAPAACNGVLGAAGDVDCFKFAAKAGQVYDVRVHARGLRTPVDSVISIQRISGAAVAANDDSDTPDSYLRLSIPADDEYVLSVWDHLKRGGPEYVYRVEVTPVEPRLTLTLPEREQYVDIVAPLPKGNRLAVMVAAQRDDFGGKVDLELKDLPAGVTVETQPIAEDETAVPVLLTAAAEAPVAGSLVDLIGRTAAGGRTIEGRLRQHTYLVRGQNNRDVWSRDTYRMATAVTEAVPFTVDLLEPKAPLVQSGSMELKITATRQSGFNTPIVVAMLYSPPGISAVDSVTIPEGQSQVALPLTANSDAKLGTWRIAVLGRATVGDGPAVVSSKLVNLVVADPYFAFTFPGVAIEQGKDGALALGVTKRKDFEATARLELVGLPAEVTSQPCEISKDAKEAVFPLKTTAKSPPGQHKTLVCRAVIQVSGEPVTHVLGTGELRILNPPPQPPQAAAPPPTPEPKPQQPVQKQLSRLEQLRLERQQAAKAEKK